MAAHEPFNGLAWLTRQTANGLSRLALPIFAKSEYNKGLFDVWGYW